VFSHYIFEFLKNNPNVYEAYRHVMVF